MGGVSEPTFGQRVIEDDFRLQEGEVNLLGGLIQRTLTDQVQGVPGLGDIPGIRYLFSQTNKEVNDQEVLVMLKPSVIRLPEPGAPGSSAVSVGSFGGGEERPGCIEKPTPRRFQPPSLEIAVVRGPSWPYCPRAGSQCQLRVACKMVKKRNQFSDEAFMLIELIAAITILLVLTTLALPLARN